MPRSVEGRTIGSTFTVSTWRRLRSFHVDCSQTLLPDVRFGDAASWLGIQGFRNVMADGASIHPFIHLSIYHSFMQFIHSSIHRSIAGELAMTGEREDLASEPASGGTEANGGEKSCAGERGWNVIQWMKHRAETRAR